MLINEALTTEIDSAVNEEFTETEERVTEEKNVSTEEENSKETEGINDTEDAPKGGDTEPNTETSEEEQVKEEVVPSTSEEKVQISDTALTRAVQAGFSLEEARSFTNEDSLNRVVDRVIATRAQDAAKEESNELKTSLLDNLPKLDPEEYTPEFIEVYDKLTAVIRSQQEALDKFQQQQEQTIQATQAASAKEAEQWFDERVASLGKDFAEALGEGGYSSLAPGSTQLANRDKVANQVAVMLAGYQQTGQTPPPRDEIFDAAARLVLHNEYQKIEEQKLSEELKSRSKQHMQRAESQKVNEKSPIEDQIATMLDEKYS